MKIKIHEAGTVEQRLPKFLKKRIIKLKELARLMGIRFVMVNQNMEWGHREDYQSQIQISICTYH
eukprot:1395199-Amorphochlora_amoeboformis.AAC.2